jgi:hypothetical protein
MQQQQNIHRLRQMAQEVHQYQTERGWSDARLYKSVASIGSTKTYKRILDPEDDLDGLSVENQVRNFEIALETITLLRQRDTAPEVEFPDFANITDSLSAVIRALGEESVARFVVIQGESGTGKDAVKNAILRKFSKLTVPVEANELWKESAAIPLLDILRALDLRKRSDAETGEPFKIPPYPQARLELIIGQIGDAQTILLINEAHHFGPRGINLVKTLLNSCPRLVVVFLCIPSLLNRLIKTSYEECIQLFGNRLCERVQLKQPPQSEVLTLLERRGVKFEDRATAHDITAKIAELSCQFGNWRFVTRLGRELRAKSDGKPVTVEIYARAKTLVESRLVPSRYTRVA